MSRVAYCCVAFVVLLLLLAPPGGCTQPLAAMPIQSALLYYLVFCKTHSCCTHTHSQEAGSDDLLWRRQQYLAPSHHIAPSLATYLACVVVQPSHTHAYAFWHCIKHHTTFCRVMAAVSSLCTSLRTAYVHRRMLEDTPPRLVLNACVSSCQPGWQGGKAVHTASPPHMLACRLACVAW